MTAETPVPQDALPTHAHPDIRYAAAGGAAAPI
jgi:hypothetical protein